MAGGLWLAGVYSCFSEGLEDLLLGAPSRWNLSEWDPPHPPGKKPGSIPVAWAAPSGCSCPSSSLLAAVLVTLAATFCR